MSDHDAPDGRSNAPKDHPEDRVDAGRRPGMHPEAQRSGTGRKATAIMVGALVLILVVFVLVAAGIIGN